MRLGRNAAGRTAAVFEVHYSKKSLKLLHKAALTALSLSGKAVERMEDIQELLVNKKDKPPKPTTYTPSQRFCKR